MAKRSRPSTMGCCQRQCRITTVHHKLCACGRQLLGRTIKPATHGHYHLPYFKPANNIGYAAQYEALLLDQHERRWCWISPTQSGRRYSVDESRSIQLLKFLRKNRNKGALLGALEQVVWQRTGHQDVTWILFNLTICTSPGARFLFEASFHLPDYVIGLDEIQYQGEFNAQLAIPGQCLVATCNFERNLCGWSSLAGLGGPRLEKDWLQLLTGLVSSLSLFTDGTDPEFYREVLLSQSMSARGTSRPAPSPPMFGPFRDYKHRASALKKQPPLIFGTTQSAKEPDR